MATKGSGRPSKYVLADGTPVVGVTTVLGRFKESGALIQWAYKRGKAGLDLYGSRDEAADVGSLIHAMVEADIHGLPLPEVPPEFADKCASGFRAWRTWREGRSMEIVATEVPIVSERHRFGGTIDAIGQDANGLCLLDWKSSNGVYADYALQLAAYRILWEEANPDRLITGGFHLARFSKEHGDMEHRYWPELNEAGEEFLLLARAYELDKRLKDRIK